MSRSHFKFDPDPPVAGQAVTVTYGGNGSSVTWQVDGGNRTRQAIPPKSFRIDPVPSGELLLVWDDSEDPQGQDGASILNPRTTRGG